MFHVKRRLAFVAIPATLAVGALSYGSVVAMAAPSPTASGAPTQPAAAEPADSSSTEQPETATEQAEPNEPAQPGGGHADTNDSADTQQEGVN